MALAVVILLLGCDSSSVLFSEADRKSVYTVTIASGDVKLASGAIVSPGQELSVAFARMSGSSSPVRLGLDLLDSGGEAIATLSYATPEGQAAAPASKAVAVPSLESSLPSFTLPESLGPGVYTLVSFLEDAQGTELQRSETVFFIGPEGFGLDQVSLYPASPAPGSAVFLSVKVKKGEAKAATFTSGATSGATSGDASSEASGSASVSSASGEKAGSTGETKGTVSTTVSAHESDPWLRWTYNEKTLASGYLSEGLDKVVWKGAASEGAYSVSVDLYPEMPPESALGIDSPWHSEVKIIVVKNPDGIYDEFALDSSFISHISFDGDFEDSGSRSQSQKPAAFGSPLIEPYAGNFGYRLGPNSGLTLPGLVPPSSAGSPLPFSLLWRIYVDADLPAANSDLIRFTDQDSSLLLRVGVDADLHPFAEIVDDAGSHRSVSEAVLGPGLSDIALSFILKEGKFELLWSIEGKRSASPALPARLLPVGAKAVLGGNSALPAIYDEFALSLDTEGMPALFRAAAQRKYRSSLVLAEGFESLSLPVASQAEGGVSSSPGALALAGESSLVFLNDLESRRPLAFDLWYSGSGEGLSLRFSSGEANLFSVLSNGSVVLADGKTAGLPIPVKSGRIAFILRAGQGKLEILGSTGLVLASIELDPAPSALSLAVANAKGAKSVSLTSLLVRVSPESLSLADSPRFARLK